MVNVSHIVEKLVREHPFLQIALEKGIVNNAALAEELMPEIEKELGKKVKFSAVNMAIRRLSEKIMVAEDFSLSFGKHSHISAQTNLFEITVYKMENVQKYIERLYGVVDFKNGDFLTVTQGLYEISIIANAKNKTAITKIFPVGKIKKILDDLCSITISIPEDAYQNVGYFYLVTKSLHWENIPIIDIVSTFTEMTFVIDEKYLSRAMDNIKQISKS